MVEIEPNFLSQYIKMVEAVETRRKFCLWNNRGPEKENSNTLELKFGQWLDSDSTSPFSSVVNPETEGLSVINPQMPLSS